MTTYRTAVLTPVSPTESKFIEDAFVEVIDGKFGRVEPYTDQNVDEVLKGVITPGFVDGHLHAAQTRIIGSASGPLLDWLDQSTFPEEQNFADPEFAARTYEVFADQVIAAGTTMVMAYGSVHPKGADALFEVMAKRGLRGIAGPVLMDTNCPEPLKLESKEAFSALNALGEKWHQHDDGRLQVAVIPRFALSCTAEMMQQAGEFARDRDWWMTTHLSENLIECQIATEMYDAKDYLEVYEKLGLVYEKSVFAHCIHLSDSEWKRFHDAGAVVAHCPDSNDFLGSGGMPYEPHFEQNIPLVMGTDVAAGRSFKIPRSLSHAYDNGMRQGRQLAPEQLFWWGTRGGALALGEHRVGQIHTGLEADFVQWSLPSWVEDKKSIFGQLLFNGDARPPLRVFVRGKELT